jgi:hypothetical protein
MIAAAWWMLHVVATRELETVFIEEDRDPDGRLLGTFSGQVRLGSGPAGWIVGDSSTD